MDKLIAQQLLKCEAVTLNTQKPYTWASGIKSPIYCDNRILLSYPESRTIIVDAFVEHISKNFKDIDAVVGTATAGISWAALIAQKMNLSMAYVRNQAKGHGKQNAIEGKLNRNSNVIVIEDLISTGQSSIKVCDTLIESGVNVLGVVSIFTYNLKKADQIFANKPYSYTYLCNFNMLINEAIEQNIISKLDYFDLLEFQINPSKTRWNV